jgi:ABC-type Fe3+/spermidine/putrescine transport system ATPase subunit
VVAFAGSGKTTALRLLAGADPTQGCSVLGMSGL